MLPFPQSSHCKNWLFTPDKLRQIKEECNQKAFVHIRQKSGNGESQPPSSSDSKPEERRRRRAATPLTVDEEDLLKRHHVLKIQEICTKLKYPDIVMATAIAFFKRFYLANGIAQYTPTYIM